MIQVLITASFPSHLLDKIQAVSPQIKIEQISLPDNKWPEEKTTPAEVFYAISDIPRPEQAPNLRWVQTHWAGIDQLRNHPIWDSDIQITTTSGIHAPNIGQYVMAQILAWVHHVPGWFQAQQKGEWPKNRWQKFVPVELRGQTLGILGYGSIGREVARLAKSFGLKVLATKQNARRLDHQGYTIPGTGDPTGEMADRIYPAEATRSMVAECDFVVVTLPLTSKTHHLFNENLLKEMKPNCYLVNVGRGGIIKEADLVKALKRGWIAGAGLDVFEEEPLPAESPLWKLENVILSPHVSGFTPYYDDRATDVFTENLRRYLSGDALFNLVDREKEY